MKRHRKESTRASWSTWICRSWRRPRSASTNTRCRSARSTAGCPSSFTAASGAASSPGSCRASGFSAPAASTKAGRARISRAPSLGYDHLGLAGGFLDRADLVDGLAVSAELVRRAPGVARGDDHHHADAAVEDLPHLFFAHLARLLQPLEYRRSGPAVRLDRGDGIGGQDARDIACDADAGDV